MKTFLTPAIPTRLVLTGHCLHFALGGSARDLLRANHKAEWEDRRGRTIRAWRKTGQSFQAARRRVQFAEVVRSNLRTDSGGDEQRASPDRLRTTVLVPLMLGRDCDEMARSRAAIKAMRRRTSTRGWPGSR
jgi:hypothetical protein